MSFSGRKGLGLDPEDLLKLRTSKLLEELAEDLDQPQNTNIFTSKTGKQLYNKKKNKLSKPIFTKFNSLAHIHDDATI